MWKWCCALAVLTVVIIGCASDTGDRLKRFFFEIPDESVTESDSIRAQHPHDGATDAPSDKLILPEPRFASIHAPFADHECSACHDMSAKMAVAEDQIDSCGECHEDYFDEDLVMHEVVADGDCSLCHLPHRSEHRALLTQPLPDLCTDCHDMDDLDEETHPVAKVNNCTACHSAHFGGEHLLKSEDD